VLLIPTHWYLWTLVYRSSLNLKNAHGLHPAAANGFFQGVVPDDEERRRWILLQVLSKDTKIYFVLQSVYVLCILLPLLPYCSGGQLQIAPRMNYSVCFRLT
jgi:hypothetical protein